MTTDSDMLARHLINVWGDFVKTDDIPDELVMPFALHTLQHADATIAALRARVRELEEALRPFADDYDAENNITRDRMSNKMLDAYRVAYTILEEK